MKVISKIEDIKKTIKEVKNKGKTIGFVPTMGYLHEGHLSLIKKAKENSDFVVVSIYVNPTQFGPNEDFDKYPRDIERDKKLLINEGVDLLYLPQDNEIYPKNFSTFVDIGEIGNKLCGKYRPGHFRGVTTIVLKLFNIVNPDIAVFGKKDAQQLIIIKKMVKELHLDVKILEGDTIREKDGLAMSSRNTYLNKEEREAATKIYKSLLEAQNLIKKGIDNPSIIKEVIKNSLIDPLINIQYIEIVDIENLNPVQKIDKDTLVAIACFVGQTRLIDNFFVKDIL